MPGPPRLRAVDAPTDAGRPLAVVETRDGGGRGRTDAHNADAPGLPIGEHLARADARFALAWWHWFFFAQTEKPAERLINADPAAWYQNTPEHMGTEAHADLWQALRNPDVVHAMIEDYRAGVTVDRDADDADRAAGNRIRCPVLVEWSARDDMEALYGDIVPIWREWADDVSGVAIDSGTTSRRRRRTRSPPRYSTSSRPASETIGRDRISRETG